MDGSKCCYFKAHLKYSRDGTVVKSACSSSIGPEFQVPAPALGSSHCNYSPTGSDALFWPLWELHT